MSKNLFLLNSILVPILITALATGDAIADEIIKEGRVSIAQVSTTLQLILRYSESEVAVHTPLGFPGRDEPKEETKRLP
jgi:hypothetical protein